MQMGLGITVIRKESLWKAHRNRCDSSCHGTDDKGRRGKGVLELLEINHLSQVVVAHVFDFSPPEAKASGSL